MRATGAGLWQDDGHVEEDSIVVIEVTTANIDPCFWAQLRECHKKELAQDEIVIAPRKHGAFELL